MPDNRRPELVFPHFPLRNPSGWRMRVQETSTCKKAHSISGQKPSEEPSNNQRNSVLFMKPELQSLVPTLFEPFPISKLKGYSGRVIPNTKRFTSVRADVGYRGLDSPRQPCCLVEYKKSESNQRFDLFAQQVLAIYRPKPLQYRRC